MAEPDIARQSRSSILSWRAVLHQGRSRPVPHWSWSWILCFTGWGGLLIAGQWHPWGWLLGASVQFIYIGYGLITQQYGFILSGLGYLAISLWNFGTNFK